MISRDRYYMNLTERLADVGAGDTAENPSVGCVIVSGDKIVGHGVTASGGRPHAERAALNMAGARAKGATAYVTLEPCAHTGKTPPCAEAFVTACVERVVIGRRDPDMRVNGRGEHILRDAGIQTDYMPAKDEGATGFISRITCHRPFITLKIATSLDGKTACANGESRWITSRNARNFVHRLRASHDAALIGAETAKRDDPHLGCRLPGKENISPVRILLDARAEALRENSQLTQSSHSPLWVVTAPDVAPPDFSRRYDHISYIACRAVDGRIDLSDMCHVLAKRGVNRLLVEAGGRLNAAFIKENLWNALYWFTAPVLIGHDGKPAFAMHSPPSMQQAPRLPAPQIIRFFPDFAFLFKNPS